MVDVVAGAHGRYPWCPEAAADNGSIGVDRWLLRTTTGSLADGADTAALLLAAGAIVANGGADRSVGGARVLSLSGFVDVGR
jgi:hypothetical protein